MSAIGLIIIGSVIVIVVGLLVHGQLQRHRMRSTAPASTPLTSQTIRYLPLGDSYTIGESVKTADRWPNQLVARLQRDGTSVTIVDNPSVTGYTTQNLIDRELPLLNKLHPDFVTVLIGVNDYVQGVSADTFQKNLNHIIDRVQAALPDKTHLVLVTIPDYGKTPTGARYGNPVDSEAGIKYFNAIITAAAQARSLPVADVFPASQQVQTDQSLIASDGLHPSGKQYALWTDSIYAAARPLLTSIKP